jgi:hypothetical protein
VCSSIVVPQSVSITGNKLLDFGPVANSFQAPPALACPPEEGYVVRCAFLVSATDNPQPLVLKAIKYRLDALDKLLSWKASQTQYINQLFAHKRNACQL